MRILLIMDPGILVPPQGYGGHERLVYLFAKEYTRMGHEVHLLVTEGSVVEGCTVHALGKEGFPQAEGELYKTIRKAWSFLLKHRNDFDLVHNFGRLLYLLPIFNHPVKKIMTYGREINASNIQKSVLLPNKNLVFTGCSNNLVQRSGAKGNWHIVYNAINFEKYDLNNQFDANAPLIFLGRIEKVKGCHTAIKIAKETGNKLIIAGNISPLAEEREYFKKEIEPYLDGEQIVHVGQVNDEQKNYYLQKAKALLFPIEWNEPFGIVMIEAMACGTPVIAYKRGSVNEVVDEAVTGFKVENYEDLKNAIQRLSEIDRRRCRDYARQRFDTNIIARQYLSLFDKNNSKKIVIVTTGQPAANPRVMKEYEALIEAGYDTKVIYTYSAEWSYVIDAAKFEKGVLPRKDFIPAGGDPHNSKTYYFFSRVAYRFCKILMKILPVTFFKEMAIARASLSLWLIAPRHKGDLYIAHYVGALPAVARAAKKNGAAYAFDAEDYHRGEPVYYRNQKEHIVSVEDTYLPAAVYISGASPLIAESYKRIYPGKKLITLNNVFSKQFVQPLHSNADTGIKLFWFSQNIGPNRGLEVIVEAMNKVKGKVSLHLLGNNKNTEYYQSLLSISKKPEQIHLIAPVEPEEVFKVAAKFDIGLASELPLSENRNLCLTNKIFTYVMAGNCILASDTDAQKAFMESSPGIGLLYKANDADDLVLKLDMLISDRKQLHTFKINSLSAGTDWCNWESERKKLLDVVAGAI